MRRGFIAGNWKMNLDAAGALRLARALKDAVGGEDRVDVGVFPPFVYVPMVAEALRGTRIAVGAQNLHAKASGAFTGEVSGPMIRDVGATHVLIGHSERRQYFGETDDGVREKVAAALGVGLSPVVCIGETLDQRRAGATEAVLGAQIEGMLRGLAPDRVRLLVVAYEPVWAIGTGVSASREQAQEAHAFVRERLAAHCGREVADGVRILYGGSVNPRNAAELLSQRDIDGALVGGASLDPASFLAIVRAKEA